MSEHDPHRTDTRSDEQRALDDSRVIASELLGAVVSLIPDAAVVADPEGRIVSVNAHLEQLFRYSSGSLTGLSVEILIPERVRRRHQGLRASYMDDPQIRSMGAGLHLTGRRSDGTEFPIDISLAPITNSGNQLVVAAIRDVSQQRQAAAAQAELATIVSSSSDAIFTTSLDGHLTNWNPGAETLFGFNKEEILGQHIATLVPGHASDVLEELLGAAADNRHHAALDTRWSRKDGREVDVAVSISPLKDSAGEVIGFSSIVRDISVRKSAENEVRRLREHNVLIDDRERIARDLHDHVIQRLFAAGLGLQSSLAWIAESNARTRVSESVDILDEIIREIRNTIFSLGSQDDNELNLRAQILDVVRQTSTALGFDPSIEFDAAEEIAIPSRVISDAVACVREALSNVARHAHASHALVQVEVDATALRVTVSDDGIGIGPNSRTSGLGNLAERARLLGGTFEITNASTGGTRLQWVVPIPSQ